VLGASARSGDPLLDAGRSPSLRHLASRLFQQAVLVERRVDTDEGMALAVRGFRHTDERLAVLIVDDVTSQERRAQAEMLHADGPHLRARIVLSRGVTEWAVGAFDRRRRLVRRRSRTAGHEP